MPQRVVQGSFTSGELDPALHARTDLARYITGLATCRNFIIHAQGGASNRPGFQFITEVKDSNKQVRLIPFAFNDTDTYALELGDQYLRVVRNAAQVVLPSTPAAWTTSTPYSKTDYVSNGGVNYYCTQDHTSSAADEPGVGANWTSYWHALTGMIVEIPTPYLEAELFDLNFVQSADIITLVHENHPPMELSRTDHHVWSLDAITFAPKTQAPTGVSGSGGSGTVYNYVVTAVDGETGEESLPSASASMAENGGTLTWTAVSGASSYSVYKEKNGVYGFIGTAGGTSFKDEIIIPETGDTPPSARNPFAAAGDYPRTAIYHEQRLVFGSSKNQPQTLWFSQTGNFHNMSVSNPSKADDAITATIDGNQVNIIRGMGALNELLVLTLGAEYKVTAGDKAFTAANLSVRPQSSYGASKVRPLVIGSSMLFVQAMNNRVRDLAYALESDSYTGNDLSILSRHLFDGYTLVDWCWAQQPWGIVWAVRSDGTLLSFTYQREHKVWAWARHDTDGKFESVTSVAEGDEDAVYVVVNRTIGGATKRYIERLHTRRMTDVTDAFFVDSGLSYSGAPATVISGLSHLEGEKVAILADGNVHPQKTVSGGQITLDYAASKVHAGLPYSADLETLEPPIQFSFGRHKVVSRLIVKVLESRGLWAGPDSSRLVELKQRTDEKWGDPIALFSGNFEIAIGATWGNRGALFVRQQDPLPLTVLAVIADVEVGG